MGLRFARLPAKYRELILLQEQIKRRAEYKTRSFRWDEALVASLFDKQARFVLSSAKAKIAQCTRRAGKTHAASAHLALSAHQHKGSTALYLALTRKSAKRLLWPKLKQLKRDYGVPLEFNESDLVASLPNGSQIMLYGADQENMAERLRGDAYSIVIVDEAASFGANLEYVLTDVVEPALLDYQGSLCMIGSPGPVLAGPFYEACTDPKRGWEMHKWSVLDNAHLPHAAKWIEELKIRRGWNDDNPTYLREYCNVWCDDPDSLVYKFTPDRNEYTELPSGVEFSYVLGMDLGYEDAAAWGVVAFSEDHPVAYLVHSESHSHWIPSQWSAKTKALQERYRPIATVADCGALGKAIVEEMNARYQLGIVPAEKSQKMTMIELMNGDFRSERLMVHESLDPLKHQYKTLVKDKTGTREDPTMPNDLCDSMLYPYRFAYHYLHRDEPQLPEKGSEQWYAMQEQAMFEKILNDHTSSQNWWENERL